MGGVNDAGLALCRLDNPVDVHGARYIAAAPAHKYATFLAASTSPLICRIS
jgi:hypothetical protein